MSEESPTIVQPIRFLHPVGVSTLQQGITVPVGAQISWLADIKKGDKVVVEIRFGCNQSVQAYLRRINNAVGHLQFRYDTQQQIELRHYLRVVFGEKPENAVLEITEVEPRCFLLTPIVQLNQLNPTLSLYKPHFHHLDEIAIRHMQEFCELDKCLTSIGYDAALSQNDYNKQIAAFLLAAGWKNEVQVLREIGLRCDFERNGVWLEIEFGNARTYYQDYIKFLLALHYREARFGILLCPTSAFAQLLCELGQKRAMIKRHDNTRVPQYSGMMTYEKAMRELPFLQFMLNGGVIIAGIDVQGTC